MAAFSYQLHQTCHNLDSMYNLQTSQMRMSGLLDDSTLFSHFYQPESSLHQVLPVSSNDRLEHSLTNKTLTDSSSVTDKLESGEQVSQNMPPAAAAAGDNKRKSEEAPSMNSALSKGLGRHGRGKKQRKCSRNMKNDEEKKPKEDRKNQKKTDEEAPTGYIHVRARRGQATDSHSLAERVRREKISERMKLLQALVPGCDKVTGKALMLDEIINYVQSLQNQVEFLSMKLASLNPLFYDFGMDFDSLIARPDQTLSNMASPTQNMQQCEPIQGAPTTILSADTRTDAAANSYNSQLDTSAASVFFPQILSQGNGQVLWGLDEQRQKLINNQTGFTNNLCSFH